MGNITLFIAEKAVKVIAAYLLGEDKLITANDIASLCSAIFKDNAPISQLQLTTSLQAAQIQLSKGIETILSRSHFSEEQKSIIKENVLHAIDNTDLSSAHLVKLRNDPNKLFSELVNNCTLLNSLSQEEEVYVKRCLNYLSTEIVNIISKYSSDFTAQNYREILQEIDKIKDYLSNHMEAAINSIPQMINPISDFYSEYKLAIKRNHSYVELFSSKINDPITKSYQLDLAYIELFLKLNDLSTDKPLSIQQLLTRGQRWIITGEAGCGKTTLLKWLAYSLASTSSKERDLDVLNGYFPVLITLRKVENWDKLGLKQAIQQELSESSIKIPYKFLNGLRSTGEKLLLLIDGLDEVDEVKRGKICKWIFELDRERSDGVRAENEKRLAELRERTGDKGAQLSDREKAKNELVIILTSRPIMSSSAVSSLKTDMYFKSAYVQPMTYMDVQRFVDYWHNAISYDRYFDEDMLLEKARQLKSRIGSQESLSRLAQNPLLCAMICALHFKKDGIMPTNKLELYDSCAQMLLEDRDTIRNVETAKNEYCLALEYEDKRRILSDLALWMLESDGALLMDFSLATNRLKRKITFIQKISGLTDENAELQANLILTYFIERGGILRWIGNGKIGFIHKTFQEYFAAYQIYLGEEWEIITSPKRAIDTMWRETIILSVSFSSKSNAEEVIGSFLCRSGDRHSDEIGVANSKKDQIIYKLLAINCAAAARELEPQTKSEIDLCTKSLIPPNSTEIGKALSNCGNLVVPILAYDQDLNERDLSMCARVLLEIGSRQSLAQMIAYLDCGSRKVYETFSRYWNYLSADTLAESGIIPAYIEAIYENSIKREQKTAILNSNSINQLSRVARFCTYSFSNNPAAYVLSETMKGRLGRRLSRIEKLIINNHMFTEPRKNEAILKILDLFSISTSITTISVAYEYDKEQISKFRSIISQFKSLSHLVVNDVPHDIRDELESELVSLDLDTIKIKEIH